MRRQTGNDAEGAYAAQLEVDEARLRGTTSQLVVPFERREAGATPAGVDVDVDRPWFEARYDFVRAAAEPWQAS